MYDSGRAPQACRTACWNTGTRVEKRKTQVRYRQMTIVDAILSSVKSLLQDGLPIIQQMIADSMQWVCDCEYWLSASFAVLVLASLRMLFRPARCAWLVPKGKTFEALCKNVLAFEHEFVVAKSNYIDRGIVDKLVSEYAQVFKALDEYDKRRIDERILSVEKMFHSIIPEADLANKQFITDESLRYDQLFGCLDERQREACIVDELATLVVAGAGSGKTKIIQKKVEYLIRAKGVLPRDILLLAFTNKAADEMTNRLQESLPRYDIAASTFHKFGLNVVKAKRGDGYDVADQMLCNDTVLRALSPECMTDEECRGALKFFAFYINSEPDDRCDYESLGDFIDSTSAADFRTIRGSVSPKTSFAGESVKSFEELEIANWLYLNGIEYRYEFKYDRPYTKSAVHSFRAYKPDFYLPQYDIWIEHFGIDEFGNPPPFFSEAEKNAYVDGVKWKRDLHRTNGTKLVETYSWWHRKGMLSDNLWEKLKELGVIRHGVDPKQVWKNFLESNKTTMIREFARLVSTFISLAKSNRYTSDTLCNLPKGKHNNGLSKARLCAFIEQATKLYRRYEEVLDKENAVDFHDMINEATDVIAAQNSAIHRYKYIIVDEFQDISVGRKDLLKSVISATGAKLFCVGDDWQSIYRFAGSDVSIFTNFEKHFGFTHFVKLENTYRNSQELLKLTGGFVMKNRCQIRKNLKSSLSCERPVVCISYEDNNHYGNALLSALEDIAAASCGESKDVLLLGRHNRDASLPCLADGISPISNMETFLWDKHPELRLTFMTIHKAKGLEADFVILLNFKDDLLGLPNKIGDDPILSLLLAEKETVPFAEERRVFYVALTRTKTRAYILMPQTGYSVFYNDLPAEVRVCGVNGLDNLALCPKCKTGRLITRTSKLKDGGDFYGCSNYPRCDYSLPMQRVPIVASTPRCRCGGFLVPVHNPRNGEDFLGCTEYKRLPSARHISKAIVEDRALDS